jgi:hypothetical protein
MMHDVLAVLSIVLYGMSIIWLVVDVLNHKTSRFVIVPACGIFSFGIGFFAAFAGIFE